MRVGAADPKTEDEGDDQHRANDHDLDDIVVRNSGGRMASGLGHNALIVTAMNLAKMSFQIWNRGDHVGNRLA